MGLNVVVGVLAEARKYDPAAIPSLRQNFVALNSFLHAKNLAEHHEPEHAVDGLPWLLRMANFDDLHALRRLAVWLLSGRGLPTPEQGTPATDMVLREYYSEHRFRRPMTPGQMSPHHSTPWAFKHLLMHSDAAGFYLPLPFKFVLVQTPDHPVPGEVIGSALRLKQECIALARHMELPLDTDTGLIFEQRGEDPLTQRGWRRFPLAAYACLQLYRACDVSLRHNAAIAFT